MKNLFILALSVLILQGCSWPSLGYRYGDWLIKKRILEVVKLYSAQQDQLEKEIDEYMEWHQKKMLGLYEKKLEEVKTQVASKKELTASEIERHMIETRGLYLLTILPLADRVIPILSELKEEQVERSKTLVLKKIDERKDQLEWDRERLIKETHKKWQDNLIDWLGSLSKEQEALLKDQIPNLLYSPKQRYAQSIRSFKNYFDIFEEGEQTQKARQDKLKKYFYDMKDRDDYKEWRQKASLFLAKFSQTLTDEQRAHLLKKMGYWLDVLKELKSL